MKYTKDLYPRISIVTITLNRKEFIETAINSLIKQNYPNLEYIVIDGASTDGTIDIINKYREHIDQFISEKDSGPSNALNKGMRLAKGEIIGILNSDDFFPENTLIQVGEAFIERPELEIVSVLSKSAPADVKDFSDINFDTTVEQMTIHKGLVQAAHPNCRFIKKSIYDKCGYFIESFGNKPAVFVDYEFMLRISLFEPKHITLPIWGYTYIGHENSLSMNNNKYTKLKMYNETVLWIEDIKRNYLHLMDKQLISSLNKRYKKAYPRRVVKSLVDRNYKEAVNRIRLGNEKFGIKFMFSVMRYYVSYQLKLREKVKSVKRKFK